MRKLIFIFICVVLSLAHSVSAQTGISQLNDALGLDIYPSEPSINQTVEVKATGAGINLDTVKMTWVVNGKVVSSDIGVKTIQVTTGQVGSKISVSVTAATPVGNISKSISIQPTSLHLSFEGLTYTPHFFKGVSLPSPESTVRVVAFPDIVKGGVKISDSALVYTWKVNGSVIGDSSGYGKSSFLYTFPQVSRPVTIEAIASTPDQSISAKSSIQITASDPKVLVYEESPTLGLLTNKATLGSFNLTDEEVRLVAVPFYFSVKDRFNLKLNYQWRVGGNLVLSAANDPSAIVLRPERGASGSTDVSVDLNQTDTILQMARSVFTIIFGSTQNGAR